MNPTDPGVGLEALLARHPDGAEAAMHRFIREGGPGSLVLFGAGYQGELTLADLEAMGLKDHVAAFVDNQAAKWGTEVGGVPVKSPAWLGTQPETLRILVASGAYRPILDQLGRAGLGPRARVLDLSALRLGLFDRKLLVEARELIAQLAASLADDRSREVLDAVLAFRLTGDIAHVEAVCEPLHYFPPDLVRLGPDEVFVDGGAFDGDTVRAFFAATRGAFRAVHAFEPDPRNVGRLRDWVAGQPGRDRIHVHELALSDRAADLCFTQGPSMSSHLGGEGGTRVRADALDAVLGGAEATFIKYDLEGAEREALAGARETILRWRPTLAISVYHTARDLWELPALVRGLAPGSRFHLRHASFLSFETVFFAVPGGAR